MNPLLAFYLGSHPDDRGRMLDEILRQDDFWLEVTHDYVQWLFPLDEVSRANARAPLVDGPTRDHFRATPCCNATYAQACCGCSASSGFDSPSRARSCRVIIGPNASANGSPTTPTTACG